MTGKLLKFETVRTGREVPVLYTSPEDKNKMQAGSDRGTCAAGRSVDVEHGGTRR